MKKKENSIPPVNINEDVWFYPVGKHLEFCVYIGRSPKTFNVPLRKILKAFKIKKFS